MSDTSTAFDARKVGDGVSIIDVHGDVSPECEDALSDAFATASEDATAGVVFNFTGLDYMNSGGIGLLVTLLVRAQRSKQQLAAFGLSDHYAQIFQLTRLDDAIGIHDTEDEAIASLTTA